MMNLLLLESWIEFHPENIYNMLPRMGIGMLVIFVIIGVIALSTVLIQKLFSGKKDK